MLHYLAVKHLHVTLVALSLLLFLARGILRWKADAAPLPRWMRVAPHIVDTFLLGAGIYLAVTAGFNPAHQPWLAAKLTALLFYIGLGLVAFKSSRLAVRRGAFILALLCAAYMVAVAVHKSPWPL